MGREVITSAQNPKIKELLALQEKSRLRREKGLFVVEGRRELEHCLNAGFRVRTVFVCPEILPVPLDSGGNSPLGSLASLDPTIFDGPPASDFVLIPPKQKFGPLPFTKPRAATGSSGRPIRKRCQSLR